MALHISDLARAADVPVSKILSLSRNGKATCEEVLRLGRRHLAALDEQLERLTLFRSRLGEAVSTWSEGGCGLTARGLCSLTELADLPECT